MNKLLLFLALPLIALSFLHNAIYCTHSGLKQKVQDCTLLYASVGGGLHTFGSVILESNSLPNHMGNAAKRSGLFIFSPFISMVKTGCLVAELPASVVWSNKEIKPIINQLAKIPKISLPAIAGFGFVPWGMQKYDSMQNKQL